MRFSHLLLSFVLICTIVSCKQQSEPDQEQTLDGSYEQLGYGHIAIINGQEFTVYDHTKISCLPVLEGQLSMFGENLSLVNDTLHLEDGINLYKFVRLDEEPQLCVDGITEEQQNDPIYNFEVLAANFTENYAYFDLRNVNWDSLYTATKEKISPETTPAQLYIIFEDMLDSFNDGHIGLDAPDEVVEAADSIRASLTTNEEESSNEKRYGDLEVAALIADHYISDSLYESRSGLVKWGYMEEGIGYVQVNLMMGHADLKLNDSLSGMPYLRAYFDELEGLTSEEHTGMEVTGIGTTMENALNDLADARALVLDARFNGGGKDEVGMEIIRQFNPRRHLVFTKKGKMGDGYTVPNAVYLEAAEQPWNKPVYLLTSRSSASATEIMVMSSLLLENVTRVGGPTEGVFSDVLEKVLPNDWEVGLSSEVYLDTQNNNYEGEGIPPQKDLGYPDDRQEFLRSLANDLEADKQRVLGLVGSKEN